MKGFGDTKGLIGNTPFTPRESASDVDKIMEKLNLPPCHIFGLANGCTVALELAGGYPSRVLSLTLCSPLSEVERESVIAGRTEVFKYWQQMDEVIRSPTAESEEIRLSTSEELAGDVLLGSGQLMVNNSKSNRAVSMLSHAIAIAKRNWSGSPEKLSLAYKTSLEWFLERRPIPDDMLKQIAVPVSIIYCSEDVAYPLECAEELEKRLIDAGAPKVALYEVPGAHYGSITNPKDINKILYETVSSCHPNLPGSSVPYIFDARDRLVTPFTEVLVQHGYDPAEDGTNENGELGVHLAL
ncbi:hypothetical protein NLJ89_g5710 [Agrocybe chaxingu]|uniref:AB hydrolase-1 domain-containing protein n=1 Tax=Agrocybe chaxingu TaxID=84603 RepID=A0A9W8K7U9_9AGAR|nr:hypothetical protein NLJ89_g5710 [Agrocybe chaxingu]